MMFFKSGPTWTRVKHMIKWEFLSLEAQQRSYRLEKWASFVKFMSWGEVHAHVPSQGERISSIQGKLRLLVPYTSTPYSEGPNLKRAWSLCAMIKVLTTVFKISWKHVLKGLKINSIFIYNCTYNSSLMFSFRWHQINLHFLHLWNCKSIILNINKEAVWFGR